MSLSMVLASYLVTYLVFVDLASQAAAAMALLIACAWWVIQLVRVHDRYAARERKRGAEGGHGMKPGG